MKTDKIKYARHPQLLLIFCGWSVSPEILRDIEPDEGEDLWLVSDYRDLLFPEDISRYEKVRLIAWSFGVYVASRICPDWPVRFGPCIAINGTPRPVDDREGIPLSVFQGTLQQLSPENIRKFNRRMCGSHEVLRHYESVPLRPFEEVSAELRHLSDEVNAHPEGFFAWDKAWVSTSDRIFPPDNQKRAWEKRGVPYQEINASHYSFNQTKKWTEWI